jgi:multidrug efflux pump subunit AcrA (membrane-fusion protein)
MANDFTGAPLIVTAASATLIYPNLIHIKGIRWVSAGAVAGHQVIIVDAAGRVVWESVASGSNYVEADATVRAWYGFAVTTLTSGTLYLEIGR